MDVVRRVRSILLTPKEEWVRIKAEPTTVPGLFTSYAMILAAVPALARLIGHSVIGRSAPFYGMIRLGIGKGLADALVFYASSLLTVYIFGFIINFLAPSFYSRRKITEAMKLAVYSLTPYWLAGILYIIQDFRFLVYVISLYGVYLLDLGFRTPMMETPKDKVMGYMAVGFLVIVILIAVIVGIPSTIFAVRYGRL